MPKFTIQQLTAFLKALTGMPCFILMPKDKATRKTIEQYIENTKELGGTNVIRSQRHLEEVCEWQRQNADKMKTAD